MKNKIILLLLILLLTSSNRSFASQEAKIISDSTVKKQATASLTEVNRNTDNFFMPVLTKEQREKIKEEKEIKKRQDIKGDGQMRGTLPPVKRLRLAIKYRKKPAEVYVEPEVKNQALLDCDTMEYFSDKTELHADGHVVMFFPKNNSTIKADRVVYNQTSNLIKAYDNVVLISDGKEILGDYMLVDLNEENSYMDNPATDTFQIRSRAKKGYMYGDKIIQEQGSIYVTKKTMIHLKSEMFGPDLDTMYVANQDKSSYKTDSHGDKFKIRTDDLIINSKPEHDTITLKHAEIYFNEKKVGTIPSITMHTNKAQDYIEGNYPELGSITNLGMYAGPGFVFDTPGGTTLKLIPILNYDSQFGFGGLAKFKSATNKTDFGYGSVNNLPLIRGKQKLDDNLYIQYGANQYLDDWFLGFRMPKYMGEVIYEDLFMNDDFLGKNLHMDFKHRIAAGYVQDNEVGSGNVGKLGSEGNVGTMRLKYMAELAQTVYSHNVDSRFLASAWSQEVKDKDSILATRLDMVFQGSAAVYGTGDTQMIARFGPRLHTQYKYWMQDLGYFLSGYSDQTPLVLFDKYMYGRSNAYIRESLRVSKYLTLSWFGSLNLANDSWDGNMIQENGFYFSIGPDDIKLNVGYDTVRQQTFVTMALNLDAKGSSVEYKRMEIKNPEKVGKNKNGQDTNNDAFSPATGDNGDGSEVENERAEVINIKEGV